MINLYTSIYMVKDSDKADEIVQCLINNVKCTSIDKIYILDETNALELMHPKIDVIPINTRPTYNMFFQAINENTMAPNEINIISNSDIYFDETILLSKTMKHNQCYALCKYEDGKLIDIKESQDSWVFKGRISKVNGNFCIGVPACDNKIAYELKIAGYDVSNPSKSIKTHHIHKTPRYWVIENQTQLPKPWLFVESSEL